tara:strand:- start:241 stop:1248 length:1008 start_codon:yes stop_codon:yes gene_type:complete
MNFFYKLHEKCTITNALFDGYTDIPCQYYKNPWVLLDSNGNYFNQSPFENIDKIKKNFKKILINPTYTKNCLYLSNPWDFNIHHVLFDLFPLIIECKKILIENNYKDFDIFINFKFKNLWEELFLLFEIDLSKINIIYHHSIDENNEICYYNYNKIYNFGINNWHRQIQNISIVNIFFEDLREKLSKNYKSNHKNKKCALLRDYDNNNITYQSRRIINIKEVKKELINNDFEILYSENMSLQERFNSFNDREIILIEAGASIVNLLLKCNSKNTSIIVVCNDNMFNYHGIYEDVLKYYFKDVKVIIGQVDNKIGKGNAYVNYPYYLDLEKIKKIN